MTIKYRPTSGGARTLLNIAATTQVTTQQSHIHRVFIATANTVAGGIYDSASVSGISAANLILPIPTGAVGPIVIDCEIFNGLVIAPGTGGVVAISYDPS